MKRLVTQKKKKNVKVPDELHYFAMTLKFYSAKAYRYGCKTFNLGFPDLSTISTVNGTELSVVNLVLQNNN